MKMTRKQSLLCTAALIVLLSIWAVPVFAAEYDVIVQAYDGSGSAYFRSGPGKEYDIICYVYNGDILHITDEYYDGTLNWGKTVYNGQAGWISLRQTAAYSAPSEPEEVQETLVDLTRKVQAYDGGGYAYFRSGPGKEYDVIDYIYDGTVLHITGEVSDGTLNWGKAVYNGVTGWISMRQTVSVEQDQTGNVPTPAPETKTTPAPAQTPAPTKTPKATPAPETTPTPTKAPTATPVPTQTPEVTPAPSLTAAPTPVPESDSREEQDGKINVFAVIMAVAVCIGIRCVFLLLVIADKKKEQHHRR